MFYAATMIIFTMYGGGFATIPAYLADMFGTMHVGGIHGRLLTAWSTAGVIGPVAIAELRKLSVSNSLDKLVATIDPAAFLDKFGAPIDKVDELVKAKTVTISKLMEIAPEGTVDPTPSLYNTTMYASYVTNARVVPSSPVSKSVAPRVLIFECIYSIHAYIPIVFKLNKFLIPPFVQLKIIMHVDYVVMPCIFCYDVFLFGNPCLFY